MSESEANKSFTFRLFLMMVLEFFIWGAWLPLIFGYLPSLGFTTFEQGLILNAFSIGAITALFFSAQFADRNFASEKFVAFSHLIGGLSIIGLFFVESFWPFFTLMLIHCLFYVPTISITNGIAFTHMKDAKRQFGIVRMGGTIGWILASWPFVFILVDWTLVPAFSEVGFKEWIGAVLDSGKEGEAMQAGVKWTYIVAGAASLVLAAYSLTLPHTPPKPASSSKDKLAWLEAARLLKRPVVLVLFVVTFLDAFIHNSFFALTGTFLGSIGIPGNWIMPIMSIGQVAEILTMLILGMVLAKLGWRWTMVIGILGHAARFGVYAFFSHSHEAIIVVQFLHGICYAFFFATLYIFVDEVFPKDARSSAQGLFNLLVLGIGPLVAFFLCPWMRDNMLTTEGVEAGGDPLTDYRSIFIYIMGVAFLGALILALFFRPDESGKDESHESVPDEVPAKP